MAGEQPDYWHQRQAFVPEGDHRRARGGARHGMLRPLQAPARGAEREGEVQAECVGQQFLGGWVPQQSFHRRAR